MSNTIARTDDEVADVINACQESINDGTARWPGMTYEQGVQAGIDWLLGDSDEHPLAD